MRKDLELLGLSLGVDHILRDHDIEAHVVLQLLLDEGLITIEQYFEEEVTDE